MTKSSSNTIRIIHGKEIELHLEALAELRIEIFREFPYLYDGSFEYEKNYLKTYVNSPESIAVLVFDGDRMVGASTGLPMEDEIDEFKAPFLQNGYHPDRIFYCGESILKHNYRGQGIYSAFMNNRENHAKQIGRFDTICFCGVVRPNNHPLRPDDYHPLDPIWTKFGYQKYPELTTYYHWKDLDEKTESAKKMVFWLKPL